jgi:hypothetical protein
VKWTPNLAPFDAAFCSLRIRAKQGFNLALNRGEPRFGSSLSLGVSLSRNEFIDHTPIHRPQPRLQSKDGLSLITFPNFLQRNPVSTAQLWQSSRSPRDALNRKELLHRIGQPTRLAPPGYAHSTKLRTSFTWERWTKYVDCFIHGPHLSS